MTTAAVEEYLAVAFRLQEEEASVTVATLAQRLSLSHASVSLMVKRLVQEELLDGVGGRPDSCPHGHPIPGRGAALPVELHALSSLEAGEKAVVVQVRREETTLLRYLARLGLLPR